MAIYCLHVGRVEWGQERDDVGQLSDPDHELGVLPEMTACGPQHVDGEHAQVAVGDGHDVLHKQ